MENELDGESLNPEGEQDTTPEGLDEDVPTVDDFNKVKGDYTNQKIRAEKAEKELKELKARQQLKPEPSTPKPEEQSNEPDYARLAYLKAEGITHPDDQKVVQDEANRLKLPLTDVLQMEHIKSRLKSAGEQREAESGMPTGKGKGGSGTTKNTVEYWVDRKNPDGTYQTPEDVDLAGKVIAAREKSEVGRNTFDPIRA